MSKFGGGFKEIATRSGSCQSDPVHVSFPENEVPMVPKSVFTSKPAIPLIVQRHAEDAAFYWARHCEAASAPEHDWKSLHRLEHLIDAHLEGVRVAQLESAQVPAPMGDAAWEASKVRLSRWGTADEAFVAATLALHAFELGKPDWLQELQSMANAQFERGRGDGVAMGLAHAARRRGDTIAETMAAEWWQQGSPLWQRAALVAAHALPTLHASLLQGGLRREADAAVMVEAAKLAGAVGFTSAAPALLALLGDPSCSPEAKRSAAAALGRLVDPALDGGAIWHRAESILLDAWVTAPEQVTDEQLLVWLWRAAPGVTRPAIEQVLMAGREDRQRLRQALRAMRLQGDAHWLPVLLQCMAQQSQDEEVRRYFDEPSSNVARLAGDVFAHITGARIGHQRWREAPEPPNDEVEEAMDSPHVPVGSKRDPDGALLWPDVEVLNREWPGLSSIFEAGRRYVGGAAVTKASMLETLANARASQQQRWQAALLLQLAQGGACFDVAALTPAQDQALQALGVTSWNW
jgi:hypothetical protein